jgi:hypothetical protein
MSDDPVNAELEEIRKLQSLTPLFRKGWAKLHSMPEKDRALIDQAFSKATLSQKTQTADAQKMKPAKAITPRKAGSKPKKAQTKKQGPSHSH